jgi:hypothetical protein
MLSTGSVFFNIAVYLPEICTLDEGVGVGAPEILVMGARFLFDLLTGFILGCVTFGLTGCVLTGVALNFLESYFLSLWNKKFPSR